jgi:apolipoprotein N-acyltransferase
MDRVLARQDFYATSDRLMLADVPTQRVPTIYRVFGEWFAYAGMALALFLCVWGIVAGRKKKAL